jgi:hypothetical protein
VKVLSANNVWAVGTFGPQPFMTLTLNWNGSSWNYVFSPNATNQNNTFKDVDSVSSTYVWAVGDALLFGTSGGGYRTLIERYSAICPFAPGEANTFNLHSASAGGSGPGDWRAGLDFLLLVVVAAFGAAGLSLALSVIRPTERIQREGLRGIIRFHVADERKPVPLGHGSGAVRVRIVRSK